MLLPILLLSATAVLGAAPAVFATPNLALQPALVTDTCPSTTCTHGPGSQIQYTVNATGIGGPDGTVFAYQYQITYNPLLLKAVSVDSFGPFFDALIANNLAVPVTSFDNVNGLVTVAVTSLGPSTSATTTKAIIGAVTFNVNTPSITLQGGQITVVPLHTCWTPLSSSGLVQVGKYHVHPTIVYQQINLDGSLGPVVLVNGSPFKTTIQP